MCLIVAAGLIGVREAPAQWTVSVLHPAGSGGSRALGISGQTQVGWVHADGVRQASVWNGTSESWVTIHPPGASSSEARGTAMNRHVGYVGIGDLRRAALWEDGRTDWIDLTPEGSTYAEVSGTDGSQHVGIAHITGLSWQASLWSTDASSWVNLHPSGALISQAYGVRDGRQVGWTLASAGPLRNAALWSGSSASHVNLHPAGAAISEAWDVAGDCQVGFAEFGTISHAGLWRGTASSWVDLHPAGALRSVATGAFGEYQVGSATFGTTSHASLWSGTAESWENLTDALPGSWRGSIAFDVWSDGTTLLVSGQGYPSGSSQSRAILWSRPIPSPAAFALASVWMLTSARDRRRMERERRGPRLALPDSSIPPRRAGLESGMDVPMRRRARGRAGAYHRGAEAYADDGGAVRWSRGSCHLSLAGYGVPASAASMDSMSAPEMANAVDVFGMPGSEPKTLRPEARVQTKPSPDVESPHAAVDPSGESA